MPTSLRATRRTRGPKSNPAGNPKRVPAHIPTAMRMYAGYAPWTRTSASAKGCHHKLGSPSLKGTADVRRRSRSSACLPESDARSCGPRLD